MLNLYTAGCDQLASAVRQLESGAALQAQAQPQTGEPGYYTFPTDQELAAFFGMGHRLFDPAEIDLIKELQGQTAHNVIKLG